jgi:hypothetical protein
MHPTYIVLAHTAITKDDPEFSGEFGLLPCEWVIFDGVHGKAQAEAKANKPAFMPASEERHEPRIAAPVAGLQTGLARIAHRG